jgi:hypothetical protein
MPSVPGAPLFFFTREIARAHVCGLVIRSMSLSVEHAWQIKRQRLWS